MNTLRFDLPCPDISAWKAGNTGYEAAHNAQRRMKEANMPAARQQRETRALTRSVLAIAARPSGVTPNEGGDRG